MQSVLEFAMKLFLMRHGEAQSLAPSDRERNLTKTGIDEAAKAGTWLKARAPVIDFCLVSPYPRALQTFETVCNQVPVQSHQVIDDIVPSGDPNWVAEYIDILLEQHTHIDSMLVVSHMPLISRLLDALVATPSGIFFPTAGIVMIDMSQEVQNRDILALS